jgi:hypothetical protein
MKISNIKTSSDFVKEIEKLVLTKNLDFFDAVLHYCEMNNIEVETAAALVKQNSVLKAKIQYEAENLNMIRKSARLPI